jgi:hypothetical protein
LAKIRPEEVGIDKLFTLNETSTLVDLYAEMKKKEKQENVMESKSAVVQGSFGDMGGSMPDEDLTITSILSDGQVGPQINEPNTKCSKSLLIPTKALEINYPDAQPT